MDMSIPAFPNPILSITLLCLLRQLCEELLKTTTTTNKQQQQKTTTTGFLNIWVAWSSSGVQASIWPYAVSYLQEKNQQTKKQPTNTSSFLDFLGTKVLSRFPNRHRTSSLLQLTSLQSIIHTLLPPWPFTSELKRTTFKVSCASERNIADDHYFQNSKMMSASHVTLCRGSNWRPLIENTPSTVYTQEFVIQLNTCLEMTTLSLHYVLYSNCYIPFLLDRVLWGK